MKYVFLFFIGLTLAFADTPKFSGFITYSDRTEVSIDSEDTGGLWLQVGKTFRTLTIVQLISPTSLEVIYRDSTLILPLQSSTITSTTTQAPQSRYDTTSQTLVFAPPKDPSQVHIQLTSDAISAYLLALPKSTRLDILRTTTRTVIESEFKEMPQVAPRQAILTNPFASGL